MPATQVVGAKTNHAPALTGFITTSSYVYLAWTDASTGSIQYTSTPLGGSTWAPIAPIPSAQSDKGPSLVQGPDSNLYAAWKGTGKSEIFYSTSSDGLTWSPPATVTGASTASAPSLSVGTGSVVVAYQDASSGVVTVIQFPTGIDSAFSNLDLETGLTDHAPAITATLWDGNGLVVVWKVAKSTALRCATSGGAVIGVTGVVESPGGKVKAESNHGPALYSGVNTSAPFGMVWTGLGGTAIWGSDNFPNAPFTQQKIADVATDVAPAYAGRGGLMAFKKTDTTIWTVTPF